MYCTSNTQNVTLFEDSLVQEWRFPQEPKDSHLQASGGGLGQISQASAGTSPTNTLTSDF